MNGKKAKQLRRDVGYDRNETSYVHETAGPFKNKIITKLHHKCSRYAYQVMKNSSRHA